MKRLDGYKEFYPTTRSLESIRDHLHSEAAPNERLIVAYLKGSYGIIDVMERVPDVIDGSRVLESGSVVSDGVWYWREDLVHYASKYHLRLLGEFEIYLEEREYRLPALSMEFLGQITKEIVRLDWT